MRKGLENLDMFGTEAENKKWVEYSRELCIFMVPSLMFKSFQFF